MVLAAFTLAILALGAAASGVCPGGLSGSGYVKGSSCYEFVAKEMTWNNAQSYCHSRGGRLAAVTSADIQKWISSQAATLFKGYQGVWIGLNDRVKEGSFVWDNISGIPDAASGYTNWYRGEPDDFFFGQDCVYMRQSYDWRWDDVECSLLFRWYNFICEYSALSSTVPSTLSWTTALASSSRTSLVTTVVPSTVITTNDTVTAVNALITGMPSSIVADTVNSFANEQPSSSVRVTSEADTLLPVAPASSSADVEMSSQTSTRPINTTLIASSKSSYNHLGQLVNVSKTDSEHSTRSTEATVSIHYQSINSISRGGTTESSHTTLYKTRNYVEDKAADGYLDSAMKYKAATSQSEASTRSANTVISIQWQSPKNSETTRTTEPNRVVVIDAKNSIEAKAAADGSYLSSSAEPSDEQQRAAAFDNHSLLNTQFAGEAGAPHVAYQESTFNRDMPIYLSVIAIILLGFGAALAVLGYKVHKRRRQQLRPAVGIENPLY